MGCNLCLESEHGHCEAELPDPRGYVHFIVDLAGDAGTVCLKFIDPYGNTVFNRLQMPVLISELYAVRPQVTEPAISALLQTRFGPTWQRDAADRRLSAPLILEHLDQILGLANRCKNCIHMYIKLYGD